MSSKRSKDVPNSGANEIRFLDEEMVELSFLIPGSQTIPLEKEAHRRGLTAGQLIRGLIRDFFRCRAAYSRN